MSSFGAAYLLQIQCLQRRYSAEQVAELQQWGLLLENLQEQVSGVRHFNKSFRTHKQPKACTKQHSCGAHLDVRREVARELKGRHKASKYKRSTR